MPVIQKIRRLFFPHLMVMAMVFMGCSEHDTRLFSELPPSQTGVTFNNALVIGGNPSVLEFEYMYNGAGVGVADFDQDGLQDVYFTGNMVSNRLFRNLGGFKFEDITESSGTGTTDWSNGVAVTDINQDGYPDIYVCRGGPRGSTGSERANLLFINRGPKEGKIVFTEEAAQWGLADESYSVQANFFDYDGDGDLDMYLLSNALVDFNRNTSRPKDRSGKAPSVDKLFRNNGDNTFTDVSKEANILIEGFGLGVEVCDINSDGWPDVYVSNDFLTDDFLYVNQKDGTFQNEIGTYMQHLTFNGMGNDIGDINNDGLMDVVVLDMLPPDNKRWKLTMMGNNYDEFQNARDNGYQAQYIRNTLQLNNGNGSFSEIGQSAGIAATEWSWSALLADYDHDCQKDLFITNGYRQDITNLDFMVYGNNVLSMGTEEANRKQRLEALGKLPGIKIPNYLFKNTGDLSFQDISATSGFTTPTYSNGSAYADLDNDGDLDLIINNIDDPAGIFRNNTVIDSTKNYIKIGFQGEAPNLEGIGSEVEVFYKGQLQKQYFTPFRGYLSTVESTLHFGLGHHTHIDSLRVTWPDGKQQLIERPTPNQKITVHQKDAIQIDQKMKGAIPQLFQPADSLDLHFSHTENEFVDYKIQPLLPHMHSKNGPGMAVGDINQDGLEDLYIGGASGQSGVIKVQQGDGSFQDLNLDDGAYEDMGAVFFDADSDGDQDLYVVSGGSSHEQGNRRYQDRIYQNDGGVFTKVEALPQFHVSGSTVNTADYDKDGDLDLFVGGRVRPGEYPMAPESVLLKNESTPEGIAFKKDPQALNGVLKDMGMVTSALWTDFNNDTWPDLIVVGEFMPIRFFKNEFGLLQEITETTGIENTHGWWNSITSGDFDNDGDSDYLLGNLGLNSRYKASSEEPLCIYANDYDKNGQIDPVMCYYIDGKNYIAHSRNDLIDQINAMRVRFRTYSDYANATFEESFTQEEIDQARVVKSETFANSYLENLGDGQFKLKPLARKAQIAPMYGMTIADYDDDGNLDALIVGNFFSGEVFTGRYDAAIGWFLKGNGSGDFDFVDVSESGFFVQGDAKSQVTIFAGNKQIIVSGINNGAIQKHAVVTPGTATYRPNQDDIAVRIQYQDGTIQKRELHHGSGYLSQGSRTFLIPEKATSVWLIDSNGKEREIKNNP